MSRSIVYIIDSLNAYDDSLQLNLLAAELSRIDGMAVHVAVIASSSAEVNAFAGMDVTIHRLTDRAASMDRSVGVAEMFLASRSLQRLLESLRPDVVHTWGQTAMRCMGAASAMKRSGDDPQWITTFVRKPVKSGALINAVQRRVCKRIKAAVVPHESLLPFVLEMGFTKEQMHVVPNAVTPLRSVNAEGSTTRDALLARIGLSGTSTIVAGTAADLIPATRVKDLIWATDLLTCIRDDFHLVIFGDGHQRENLERFAGFTVAASHVHFLPPEDAQSFLGVLDVYWHSHLLHRLPSSLLGAMANGVPAISVFGDGTKEIILHQQTAMAVNYGARDEFARWTKFLIEKPDAARQLADQGKAHVREQFSLEQMISAYRALLS